MKIDNLSFFILEEIINAKDTSTWKIAKKYVWDDKPVSSMTKIEEAHFYDGKAMKIHKRLKSLSKDGLIKIEKKQGEIVKFIVDENKIMKKRINLPDGNRERILMKTKDCWVIY